jgi:hypothetical protein
MLRTTDQCLDVKRAETEQLSMSPTVFKEDGYRFFFFSREELRMHVHVHCDSGEAKFWMEPKIELAKNYGLHNNELRRGIWGHHTYFLTSVTHWRHFAAWPGSHESSLPVFLTTSPKEENPKKKTGSESNCF